MAKAKGTRPAVALGRHVRALRELKGLNQIELAALASMRNDRISQLENGANVRAEQYQKVARALGYRDALDMFRAGYDKTLRALIRHWPALSESARNDVLEQVKGAIDAGPE